MQLINTSSRETAIFVKAWNFAKNFFEHADGIALHIEDGTRPDCSVQGEASYTRVVQLCVNYHAYPFTDPMSVLGVPAPTYEDFFEEFLYVLAHELEHIDQYGREEWRGLSIDMLEYKAERKAAQVLLAYRKTESMWQRAMPFQRWAP